MIVSSMKVAMQRKGEDKQGLSVNDLQDILPKGYPGSELEILLPDGHIYPVTAIFTVLRREESRPRIVFSAGNVKLEGVPYVYDKESGEKHTEYTLASEKDEPKFDKAPMAPKKHYVGVVGFSVEDVDSYVARFDIPKGATIRPLLSTVNVKKFLKKTNGKNRTIMWTTKARNLLKRNYEDYTNMSEMLGGNRPIQRA